MQPSLEMKMKTQKTAEIEFLAYLISQGGEPVVGETYTVDCRLGNEGRGSWMRWSFEANTDQLKAAYLMAAEWANELAHDRSFLPASQQREAKAAEYFTQFASKFLR